MKVFDSPFALVAFFSTTGSIAQEFCSAVTEYVTVTEYENAATNIAATNAPTTTAEAACELSTVWTTETLKPTTVTIYRGSTSETAETCGPATVELTVSLEPVKVTIFPDSSASSLSTGHGQDLPSSTAQPPVTSQAPKDFSSIIESLTPTSSSTPGKASSSVEVAPVSSEAAVPSTVLSVLPVQGKDTESPGSDSLSGKATFYGGNVGGGACSFTGYTLPSGIFGAAISDSNWDGSEAYGACVEVTGPGGNTIKAMLVDQCPGCGLNHVDLFEDAFSQLADLSQGVIDVTWNVVPCGITSPITLKNKSGASQYYFNMQVENSNVQVAKLEVNTDGGSNWLSTTRKPYNYFEILSGTGTDTVTVRITSVGGNTIVVKDVAVASDSTTSAGKNFA